MAKHAEYDRAQVIADWKTGKYSIRKLAAKHRVSPGLRNQLVNRRREVVHRFQRPKSLFLRLFN